ncbi:MAG: hypothetical protein HS115_14150 [Spirochaetales bacterium]|nr:hypothetical protein [Spirochaetales bacterium]
MESFVDRFPALSSLLTLQTMWFALFFLWGMPLGLYRSRFRKLVYNTTDWKINIKPVFWKEIKSLAGTETVDAPDFVRFRNFYRFYIFIYIILFVAYSCF